MIGDYFGVTEQSQTVSGGWNDVARRRSEVPEWGTVGGDYGWFLLIPLIGSCGWIWYFRSS